MAVLAGARPTLRPAGRAASARRPRARPAPTAARATADVPVGAGSFADANVVITQPTAGTFTAFPATCTHQGCTVGMITGNTVNCPCHGSRSPWPTAPWSRVRRTARCPRGRSGCPAGRSGSRDPKHRPRPPAGPSGSPTIRECPRPNRECRRQSPYRRRGRRHRRTTLAAAEFPPPRRAEWVALVDQVARRTRRVPEDSPTGAGEAALTRSDLDGIRVRPLYSAEDGPAPATGVPAAAAVRPGIPAAGAAPTGWDVRQRHREPDPALAAARIAADLENGVSSIWLAVGDGGTAVADLRAVLAEVYLDLAPVVLDAGRGGGTRPRRRSWPPRPSARCPTPTCSAPSASTRSASEPAPAPGPTPGTVVPLARRVAQEYPAAARGGRRRAAGARAPAAPTPRSWAGRWRPGWPTCASWPERRPRAGRRRAAAGVPLRGHGRAVPDHRQAARRAAAVVAGDRGLRRARSRSSSTRWARRRCSPAAIPT